MKKLTLNMNMFIGLTFYGVSNCNICVCFKSNLNNIQNIK